MTQPIDMQSELGRATMVERVLDATTRAAVAAAQREMMEKKEEDGLKETQVLETPEAQSEHVDEDGKRKNPYAGRRGRRDATEEPDAHVEGEKQSTKVRDSEGDHTLDVSV